MIIYIFFFIAVLPSSSIIKKSMQSHISKTSSFNIDRRESNIIQSAIWTLQDSFKSIPRSISPLEFGRLAVSSSSAVPWSGWGSSSLGSPGHRCWTSSLPLFVQDETYLEQEGEEYPFSNTWMVPCLVNTNFPFSGYCLWVYASVVHLLLPWLPLWPLYGLTPP